MLRVDPKKIATKDLHQYMLGAVAPRPIAFASTISKDGVPNLAPYSFFNAFSSNPPIVIFSSNRRVVDNSTKDTLRNVEETGEVVINMVSHHIVRQMTLTSIDYPSDVSEFEKAGLTPLASELVRPFRVKESHVQMECTVDKILPLGDGGGAGNLIICNVQLMHVNKEILTDGRIDPLKIDLMGRMGRMWYNRASGKSVMEIVQSVSDIGLGFDALPSNVRTSTVLTGNDLAELAALTAFPNMETAQSFAATDLKYQTILQGRGSKRALHRYMKQTIRLGDIQKAALLMRLAESL